MSAAILKEMMAAWSTIERRVRAANPKLSAAQIHNITAAAMNKAVGIGK